MWADPGCAGGDGNDGGGNVYVSDGFSVDDDFSVGVAVLIVVCVVYSSLR